MKEIKTTQALNPLSVKIRYVPVIKAPKFVMAPKLKAVKIVQQVSEKVQVVPGIKVPISITPSNDGDGDVAIKIARVSAIKAANLSNKNYNVGGSTSPATGTPASGIIFGAGGGGGGYAYEAEAEEGTFLSNIPSIVWIILAVAGGWFLIKSSKKSGKLS